MLVLFLGLIGVKNSLVISSARPSNGACTWTPSSPTAGDTLVITYDPSVGTIDAAVTSLNMHWEMVVDGNKFESVPSQSMWPAGTSVNTWIAPSTAITPMTNKSDGTWEVSFTLSYMVDELIVWFVGGGVTDKPGDGWIIESQLKSARIFPVSPAFNNPKFVKPGGSAEFIVNASSSATNWDVSAIGKSDTPISLSASATFDSTKNNWALSVTIPSSIPLGLYDLQYQATIGEKVRTHVEYNSLSVISAYKTDYWIIVISDQQHFRDGSYSGDKDTTSGDGNFTQVLKVLDLLDPEFILCAGDMTEWCDEIAMENQKKWIIDYLDVPMFSIPGNHDEFENTGSSGNHEYGSGRGVWQRIFGPSHWTFMYGNHYFATGFSDDQHVLNIPGESDWIQDVITNAPSSATMKTYMQHHPIDERYYGTSENVDIADDIKTWLKSGKFDYFLNGHQHSDRYSVLDGITHIGTDNCVGS